MRAAQLDRWPDVTSATDESGLPLNVQRVAKLEEDQLRARSISERIAAAVTRAAGTATFAIAHLVWFTAWIVVNSTWARGIERFDPFDPFPFNLLTMLVSLEAIFQMTRQADRRAHLDLQINLLAEQELTAILKLQCVLAERAGIDVSAVDPRLDELRTHTDVHQLAASIATEMASAEPPADQRKKERT